MSQSQNRPDSPRTRPLGRGAACAFLATSVGLLVAAFVSTTVQPAYAADAKVDLGTAASFAVLAGSTVTNTGASVVSGDLGLSPGSAVTGFPPGQVIDGTQHVADALAVQAKDDLTTAYNDAAGRPTAVDVTGVDLGGLTLTPGVYEASTSMGLTGTLVLDAQNDPASVFIFKAGSTLTTGSSSRVQFINGGSPCNVFWQVGSSATLGTSTEFIGTIMASMSATLSTSATVEGRVLARSGAVTLDNNLITAPSCTTTTPTGTTNPTATGTDTQTDAAATEPAQTEVPLGSQSQTPRLPTTTATTVTGSPRTPVIPTGRPDTGLGPMGGTTGGPQQLPRPTLLLLGGLCALGAVASGVLGTRWNKKRRG